DIAGAGGVGRAGGRRDADHAARRRQRGGPLLRPPELQGAHSPIRLRHPPGVPRHGVAALLRRDRPRRRRRPPHHAVIDFHQTLQVNGIRFWCYTAGHVLGAAMFMVDIAGVRILYTGDYSREEDRHLKAAEIPQFSPDICIIESTYGVQRHQPCHVREKRFTDATTLFLKGAVFLSRHLLLVEHRSCCLS
uniref:Metallo-beta-lactamase domain-containing protein n=1 Tax=Triticum urartu TaxID=4572 RepID=A0A8R7QKV8_TRIUA